MTSPSVGGAMTSPPANRPPARPLVGAAAAVVAAAVASGGALFTLSRTWRVATIPRAAPLPAQVDDITGAQLHPVLPALALVGLAGAAALLATNGRIRRWLGVPLALAGSALAVVGATSVRTAQPGWVALTVGCGLLLAVAGVMTVWFGGHWSGPPARLGRPDLGAEHAADSAEYAELKLWDAHDRGEDPTRPQEASGGSH